MKAWCVSIKDDEDQGMLVIKGRLKFKGATNSAPFPSCIVVFRGKS